ncbi:MAG: hypothetical protein HQK65_06240 [Desulfamplus sp.]|nr:hypothetical protein [Desulfamplus sp.]
MKTSERLLYNYCLKILLEIQQRFNEVRLDDLLQKGAEDGSLRLHTIPKELIKEKLIQDYDDLVVAITTFEKTGSFDYNALEKTNLVAFVDHIDSSTRLTRFFEFLREKQSDGLHEGKFFQTGSDRRKLQEIEQAWQDFAHTPARLTGPSCSITMVKKGHILFSVMLNYITQEIFSASESGVQYIALENLNEDDFKAGWTNFTFKKPEDSALFVTYTDKVDYAEFLKENQLIGAELKTVAGWQAGPPRILYLSELNPGPIPGFILSNGERIGKWIGWLAFCKFSDKLMAYSEYPRTMFAKDDILVAPSPLYSILDTDDNGMVLNYQKLKHFIYHPSKYREMIMVTHKENQHARVLIESVRSRVLLQR